jgi:hypothetical protein
MLITAKIAARRVAARFNAVTFLGNAAMRPDPAD